MCQAIASPSRSGSGASRMLSAAAAALCNRIHMFAVARDGFVVHRKAVFGIYRASLGNEIAHMPVGGEHLEIITQIFFEGFGLGR